MSVIASWGNHWFRVEKTWVRSISNMEIKASCETDEKTSGGDKYVTRKNSKPTEIKITIPLNAHLGINVKKEAKAFLSEAMSGEKGYFYAETKKLFTYQLMLTEATVKNKSFTPKGDWVHADVELVFKQCSKLDGKIPVSWNPSGGGGNGNTGGGNGNTGADKDQSAQDKIDQTNDNAHQQSGASHGGYGGNTNMVKRGDRRDTTICNRQYTCTD